MERSTSHFAGYFSGQFEVAERGGSPLALQLTLENKSDKILYYNSRGGCEEIGFAYFRRMGDEWLAMPAGVCGSCRPSVQWCSLGPLESKNVFIPRPAEEGPFLFQTIVAREHPLGTEPDDWKSHAVSMEWAP